MKLHSFNYVITGRTPGRTAYAVYSGIVPACTPKDAILAALACEFGDPALGIDPATQLTNSGWIDQDTLFEQWNPMQDVAKSFVLETYDVTFDVQVS